MSLITFRIKDLIAKGLTDELSIGYGVANHFELWIIKDNKEQVLPQWITDLCHQELARMKQGVEA